MRKSVFEIVTERIIEQLENGVAPWQKPWNVKTGMPRNLLSEKEYRGINVFLLGSQRYESPYWLTFKQALDRGGAVKRGERGTPVVFWSWREREDAESGEVTKIPFLKYYTVFNAAQIDGLESPVVDDNRVELDPLSAAKTIIDGFTDRPTLRHGFTHACYSPAADEICLPYPERFTSVDEYYCALFHEATHSTMHPTRLNRKVDFMTWGDDVYAKEELVAEMGAAFLAGFAGIETTINNSAAYLNGWLKALKSDSKLVVSAAAQAQRAAEYILGRCQSETEPDSD